MEIGENGPLRLKRSGKQDFPDNKSGARSTDGRAEWLKG